MAKIEQKWSPEDLAGLDFALKSMPTSHEALMGLDRLFFSNGEREVVKKLKESGHVLARARDGLPEDLKAKWVDALGSQLRESVDRAKKNSGKK